ncbi:flagellar biosynthesis protein FlhA, partial [Vibrio lentus]
MVVSVVVIAVIFMFILPLPTELVDSMIAVNICVSILLIVLVTYIPGPLAFSTFPGILLITTLFRLALSISTTRLILLEQDAGDIVETFGNFVAGGNLTVGMVIFLIITVAQFLVIAKGSERVAEVAARFTLDAMPGKQMSIDSDLRAGLIDAREARQMRMDLSRESSLFGALDGAMKFVKGDAIAGLVIVLVNLVGGLCIGILQYDMSAGDAMQLYSVLTIGDGLIAQIPALLISLTAGIIITRVSSSGSDADNIGIEMATQLLEQPRAWVIASACMAGFALVPGMPTLTFLIISVITGTIGGYRLYMIRYAEMQGIQTL